MLIATNIFSTFHEVWLLITFLFSLANVFLSESETKTKNIKGWDFGGFQSPQNEKKISKSLYIWIFGFQCVAKNIEMLIKDLYLFIVYSQI